MTVRKPSATECRTRFLADQRWECLSDKGAGCLFGIRLGAEIFCLHQSCEQYSLIEKDGTTAARGIPMPGKG